MWGIFQVFVDTIVMCTVTALVILSSGAAAGGKDGAALSAAAFSTVFGRFGGILVSVSIALFAFATLLGWSYYGECGVRYLAGSRAVPPYRVLFALMAFLGCGMELRLVWDVCDTLNGFMAFPNLIALFLLSGEVVGETGRYLAARKDGKRRGAGPAKAGGKAPRPRASASRAGRDGLQKLQKRQGRKTRFL
jgi:AGCS family alanine or glycine:cation symporter